MRRIVRSEAICLRVRDYHESSKLVTFFTLEHGRVGCLAKGARRLRSKFGAALDLFAQSRIIYYSSETRTLLTLSDAELVHSFSGIALRPERFLAAEQMAEFVLRVIQPHDPSPQLYRLLLNYLTIMENLQSSGSANPQSAAGINRQDAKGKVEMAKHEQGRRDSGPDNLQSAICNLQSPPPTPDSLLPTPCSALVCSFLLKAASFLGFRPELRRCLICRRPIENQRPAYFEPSRGGIICPRCAGDKPRGTHLEPAGLDMLAFLLYTPAAEIAHALAGTPQPVVKTNRQERQGRQDSGPENLQSTICSLQSPLDLVLGFLGHHFDPLVLNSFRWHAGLERND
jgi:recombinational DNA repair protein (RecF pathway)